MSMTRLTMSMTRRVVVTGDPRTRDASRHGFVDQPGMDLMETLTARLGAIVEQRERIDLLDEALVAALASTNEERSWALVRLAAALRARQDYDRALLALDGAALHGTGSVCAAAFTCAAAIHHDRGDLVSARKAGEQAYRLDPGDHSRRALVSIYYDLWQQTRLDSDHAAWRRMSGELNADGMAATA